MRQTLKEIDQTSYELAVLSGSMLLAFAKMSKVLNVQNLGEQQYNTVLCSVECIL